MHVKTSATPPFSAATCQSVADANMNTAAEVIRGVYGDLMDDDGVIDSYDCTWQKRGLTSHHGVGVIIEVQTGLVVDYEVLSNYCHALALCTGREQIRHRHGCVACLARSTHCMRSQLWWIIQSDGSRGSQAHLESLCGDARVSICVYLERRRLKYVCCTDTFAAVRAR